MERCFRWGMMFEVNGIQTIYPESLRYFPEAVNQWYDSFKKCNSDWLRDKTILGVVEVEIVPNLRTLMSV